MITLPELDDAGKRNLCRCLVAAGFMVEDEAGRFLLTQLGNLAGQMLCAAAMWHQQHREPLIQNDTRCIAPLQ